MSAIEVLAANEVAVMIDEDLGYTPTPALSMPCLRTTAGARMDWRTVS